MRALFIRGGCLLDPAAGIHAAGSVLTQDGAVSWIGTGESGPVPGGADVLDAGGLLVCPGFVDVHCHLREPGQECKETIRTGTRAAARGGFTTVCCMPNTDPPLDSPAAIERVRRIAAAEAAVRVLPIGCVTRGRRGRELAELAALAAAGAVAFSDDGDHVADDGIMRRALERAAALGLPVMDHCQDLSLSRAGLVNEGAVSARLGVPGMPAAAEEAAVERDLAVARAASAPVHIAHVSTAGSVALIRQARAAGVAVTAEVTPHHLTLTDDEVLSCGALAKVNPPLRTRGDVDALVRGLADGTIDAIATDHAPHADEEKRLGLARAPFGISGLETALGSVMSPVHDGVLPLARAIAALTSAPARVLGGRHGGLGRLAVGGPADIAIVDPVREWTVDTGRFASRGRNTPLAGRRLRGRVVATIAAGRLVHREESVCLKGVR